MKIAYITNYNSEEVQHWSGTGYYIAEGLQKNGAEIIRINCSSEFSFAQRLKRKLTQVLTNKLLLLEREPSYLRAIAARANKELSRHKYDLVFSPGTLPITYIKSTKPIVFLADATFDCLMRLYLQGEQLSKHSIAQGNKAEAAAIRKASLLFYTSSWAAESAVNQYNASKDKIVQTPVGANLPGSKSESDVRRLIRNRIQNRCKNFLFIGVDWHRKGAAKAIETIARLREQGVSATLTLVGCSIPKQVTLPSFATHHPFISKTSREGQLLLSKLFEQAHFFLLPTIADCTPVVFAEAASFGLPVITTNTGGCPSMIRDKTTGFCMEEKNFVEQAVKLIRELCEQETAYETMSICAYQHFCSELNWNVIGKRMLEAMKPLVHSN